LIITSTTPALSMRMRHGSKTMFGNTYKAVKNDMDQQ
jgi:hypothetical protein